MNVIEKMCERAKEIEKDTRDTCTIAITDAEPGSAVQIYEGGKLHATQWQSQDAYEDALADGMVGLHVLQSFYDNEKKNWDFILCT